MRSVVRKTVGPAFEAAMTRLESGIELADHLSAARAILDEGSITTISSVLVAQCRHELAPGRAAEPPPSDRREAAHELEGLMQVAFGGKRYERESEVHLATLLIPAPGATVDPAELGTDISGARFSGESTEIRLARLASIRLLCAAWLGAPAEALAEPLASLARTVEPGRWLLRKGTAYGGAAFLRALISAERRGVVVPEPGFTRNLCDRLLRHVEVRREEALAFLPDSLPVDAREPRERLRFAMALLEASEHYDDARYLNTALKMSDWHLASRPRKGDDPVTGLHYVAVVARQERLMRARFGEAEASAAAGAGSAGGAGADTGAVGA